MHILNGQTESRAGKYVLPGRLSERSTMSGTLNDTPGSNRLHIGVFGKTNSGKSSFINAFTHQEVSIVADVAGTTTDPVYKPMEISPLGPCVIIDTAGFDDETELGERRVEKTKLAAEKADIAVIVVSGADACREYASETKDAKEKLMEVKENPKDVLHETFADVKQKVSKIKDDLSEEKMEIKEEDIVVSRRFDEEGENK